MCPAHPAAAALAPPAPTAPVDSPGLRNRRRRAAPRLKCPNIAFCRQLRGQGERAGASGGCTHMKHQDLSWTIPVMRAGYAGRALVYLVVAGFSLWAIWHGGTAEGTSSALGRLEHSWWGMILLALIALGMASYALWRLIDTIFDLEDYGTEAKGLIARTGMLVTGMVHLAIGALAFSLLFSNSSQGDGSTITKTLDAVLGMPGGRILIGAVGLIIIGAGFYYLHKAWQEKYRERLRANHFTQHWNPVLKAGVLAQGAIITVIGVLVLYAGIKADSSEAGGVGAAFSWISQQAYGQILVTLSCIGLLGFAVFCLVNAAYRIIPKIATGDVETLAASLKAKAKANV
ncbi:DUF1206 domain-containing protein [Acuticoccus sp. MNP-M23]|uniref:DUF1206 domain-containing protein n=1 Tax=Acuticoccus sp. MNP-M23 TaxID=3072793 RepID=UPI0028151C83|nr:DUF1206 domain-containing protein [Acuticoccus sp. MNP-M23]WMS42250.1 DUF1206 domain-containing protein [Acuticoccus sp. MNP-M23]